MQLLKDAMDAIMEWGGGTKKKKKKSLVERKGKALFKMT